MGEPLKRNVRLLVFPLQVAPMARSVHRRWLLWTGLAIQLLALLIGFIILYYGSCTTTGASQLNLPETAFWSTLGLLRFMIFGMAFPLTLLVLFVMLVFFLCGSNWKRVRFLAVIAFVLWGAYWIFLAYTLCRPPPD